MRKSMWLLSAGAFALSTPAYAQEPPPEEVPASETAPSPTEAASTEEEGDVIVVTAQGRQQILQDVPIAVTAINADAMENSGATDIRQLNQLAPSLLVSSTSTEANGSARVRGIGTVGDNPGLESSVAVFIDGVYRSRSGIGLNELGEIDRVEVLRGPQGTLFGRNASAGLIHIFSKKPSFTFGGYGEATIGNYDMRRLAAGVTGPLGDTLAFRLDGVWVKRDGFYEDLNNDTTVNNRNRFFTRGQLLFEPNSDLSIRLIGDYTHRNEKCCGAVYVNNDINDNIGDLNNPSVPFPPLQANGNNIVNVLIDLGQDPQAFDNGWSRDIWVTPGRSYKGKTTDGGVSLQVDYDFGGAQLTSISAYRGYKAVQNGDFDFNEVDILYRDDNGDSFRRFKTFSQELRLQGTALGEKLDWLVGGYYANEKLKLADNLRFGEDYGRFATCRIISGGGLAGLYSPTSPNCMVPVIGPATIAAVTGASGPDINA
ncbi:MAG TPA: TonB-dependent receptor plug domain-containing protein, partial [Sphingomicrobium sp.]|nr:TonB-dependent receptor plug domain-containing protein [Sphingomicrobium sp.]